MSVLTKAFVVVVAVLAVILVAVTLPFVATTEDSRVLIKSMKDENDKLSAAAKNAAAEMAEANSNLDKVSKESLAEKEQLQAQIQQLTQAIADGQTKLEQVKTDRDSLMADFDRLGDAEKQHAAITQSLLDELAHRRQDLVTEQKNRIELAAANDRLTSDLDAAKRQLARFQEQITLLDEQNTQLEDKLARIPPDVLAKYTNPAEGGSTTAFESPIPIKGQVTKVEKADDSTFVQINVGSADGVAKNMKFLVHRGDEFLGTLVITNVDTKASAGTLQLKQGSQIAQGDAVLTGGTN